MFEDTSEQGCKRVKDELGWADFQVRSDIAIRRHQVLVNCAFSFCWDARFHSHPAPHQPAGPCLVRHLVCHGWGGRCGTAVSRLPSVRVIWAGLHRGSAGPS